LAYAASGRPRSDHDATDQPVGEKVELKMVRVASLRSPPAIMWF
jgi:hypothetical protein